MSELVTSTQEKKSTKPSTIDVLGMNNVDHGFAMSVDGAPTGGVFVNKADSAEVAGTYVHEGQALDALASSTPEEVQAIRTHMHETPRLTVDELPHAKRPNDRLVGVHVGDEKVGGGAKFVGNREIHLPNGEYIKEAALQAAIASLRKASNTVESAAVIETSGEKQESKRRILKALAAAAVLLSVLIPSASASQGWDGPEHARAVATAPLQPEVVVMDVPAQDAELPPAQEAEVLPPAETEKNWLISDGMGGEDLFNQISVEPSKWYGIQDTLLAQYPAYFYSDDSGDVRFAYAGEMPTDIQQTIESLTQ